MSLQVMSLQANESRSVGGGGAQGTCVRGKINPADQRTEGKNSDGQPKVFFCSKKIQQTNIEPNIATEVQQHLRLLPSVLVCLLLSSRSAASQLASFEEKLRRFKSNALYCSPSPLPSPFSPSLLCVSLRGSHPACSCIVVKRYIFGNFSSNTHNIGCESPFFALGVLLVIYFTVVKASRCITHQPTQLPKSAFTALSPLRNLLLAVINPPTRP